MVLMGTMMATLFTGCGSAQETAAASSAEGSTAAESTGTTAESTDGESALLKEIKERGYINIATSNDAPFCYYDVDTNELKGLDVDILKEICNRLGIPEVRAQVTDFSNMLLELNNKNVTW